MEKHREKRRLPQQTSSGPTWPWLLGGVLVLVLLGTGIGLGLLLSGGHNDTPEPTMQIAKKEKAQNKKAAPKGNTPKMGMKGGLGIGSLIGGTTRAQANGDSDSDIFEFIKKNRVYLVPTKGGRYEFASNHSALNEDSHLGAFFKAIKAHYKDNNIKRSPDKFETATYAMGPDPIKLTAETPIPYIPNGGTQIRPVHYDLRSMTVLAERSRRDPSKQTGIYFDFPASDKGQWIHIQGKGIEPFYMVALEKDRYPALVTLKGAGGIVFDDEAMTAKAKPQTTAAIKRLLVDNKSPGKIVLRAGAPLATWSLAHVNNTDTIDFKKAHLDPQKSLAGFKAKNLQGKNLTHFEKWTNEATRYYFPLAQAVAEAKKRNDLPKVLEKTTAYAEMSMRFVKVGSPILGLDDHKAALTKDAVAILQGRMTVVAARKKWATEMKKMKNTDVNVAIAKWDDKKHQRAEWERFKKHPVFYLGGTTGLGNKAVMPIVQFSQ